MSNQSGSIEVCQVEIPADDERHDLLGLDDLTVRGHRGLHGGLGHREGAGQPAQVGGDGHHLRVGSQCGVGRPVRGSRSARRRRPRRCRSRSPPCLDWRRRRRCPRDRRSRFGSRIRICSRSPGTAPTGKATTSLISDSVPAGSSRATGSIWVIGRSTTCTVAGSIDRRSAASGVSVTGGSATRAFHSVWRRTVTEMALAPRPRTTEERCDHGTGDLDRTDLEQRRAVVGRNRIGALEGVGPVTERGPPGRLVHDLDPIDGQAGGATEGRHRVLGRSFRQRHTVDVERAGGQDHAAGGADLGMMHDQCHPGHPAPVDLGHPDHRRRLHQCPPSRLVAGRLLDEPTGPRVEQGVVPLDGHERDRHRQKELCGNKHQQERAAVLRDGGDGPSQATPR